MEYAQPQPDPSSTYIPSRGLGRYGHPAYNQVRKIVAKFGGEAALAKALGVPRTTIYRWGYAHPYGSDGLIPRGAIGKLQDVARANGVLLTSEDWLPEQIDYLNPPIITELKEEL